MCSIGVCLIGNYEKQKLSKVQLNQIYCLLKYLESKYPNALLVGHSFLKNTACPGRNVKEDLSLWNR
jgi:N-acetyl-anhydromuramyl-L-alanine amidase AmpD